MFNNVGTRMLPWERLLSNKSAAAFILTFFPDDVEDWTGAEGEDFQDFIAHMMSYGEYEGEFVSQFPHTWKKLYDNDLMDADMLVDTDYWQGNEEELVQLADTKVNRAFGNKVRRLLAEEGRWDEEDLGESWQKSRFGYPYKNRKNRMRKF